MAPVEMSKEHKDILRRNMVFLIENLRLYDVLPYLEQWDVVNENMRQEIDHKVTNADKIGHFVMMLRRRGPDAFKQFICALMESKQPHVADTLDRALADRWRHGEDHQNGRQGQTSPPALGSARPEGSTPHHTEISAQTRPIDVCPDVPVRSPYQVVDDHPRATQVTAPQVPPGPGHKPAGDAYRMSRGLAVIFNNQQFRHHPPRNGAHLDSDNLVELFEELGLRTRLCTNRTAQEMVALLREVQTSDMADEDCLVVFILSHGVKGHVYGTDGHRLSIENNIIRVFDEEHCPALKDKPKIFFFQACQRDAVRDQSAQTEADGVEGDDLAQGLDDLSLQDDEGSVPDPRNHADVVISYSTVPGYRSWRAPDTGSWLVTSIVDVFRQNFGTEHLLDMLTKVTDKVSQLEQRNHYRGETYTQLTTFRSTLRKKFYFVRPGLQHH